MAVAFDAVGPADIVPSNITNGKRLSWSHTASGDNRCCVVQYAVEASRSDFTTYTRTATYGGNAMTSLGGIHVNNEVANHWMEFFYLLNPPTGAQTVQVDVVGSGVTFASIGGNSVSYTGVGSVGSLQTGFGTEAGTTLSQTFSSAANRMIVQSFLQDIPTAIGSYDKNSRWAWNESDHAVVLGDAAGAASVTFNATRGSGASYAQAGFDLLPSAGSSSNSQFFPFF